MVKIPTYEDEFRPVEVSGTPTRGLTDSEIRIASNYGLGEIGKGITNLGKSFKQLHEQSEVNEANAWMTKSTAELQMEMADYIEEQTTQWEDPSGSEFTTHVLDYFDKRKEEILSNAPNKRAEQAWKETSNRLMSNVFADASKVEGGMRVKNTTNQFEGAVDSLANLAGADLSTLFDSITTGLDGLFTEQFADQFAAVDIPGLKDAAKNQIIKRAIDTAIIKEDHVALEQIRAEIQQETPLGKEIINTLDSDTLAQTMNKIDNKLNQITADDRFYFNTEIDENLNSALETGEVKTTISPGEFERFGMSEAEYNTNVELNKKKYNAVSAMVVLPFGEMSNYIEQYPDTVEGKKIKEHLLREQNRINQLVHNDIYAFVQEYRPKINEQLKALDNIDNNSTEDEIANAQLEFQKGLDTIVNIQRDMGIKGDDISYMSKGMLYATTQMIKEVATAGEAQALWAKLETDYGRHFDGLITDLRKEGTVPEKILTTLHYWDTKDFALIYEHAMIPIDYSKLIQAEDSGVTGKTIEAAVTDLMGPWDKATVSNNTQNIQLNQELNRSIMHSAAIFMKQDQQLSEDDAVEKAFNLYIGNHYQISDNFVVPNIAMPLITDTDDGMKKPADLDTVEKMLQSFTVDFVEGLDLKPIQSQDDNVNTIANKMIEEGKVDLTNNVNFINAEDGLKLIYNIPEVGQAPVKIMQDGKEVDVLLSWEDVQYLMDKYADSFERVIAPSGMMYAQEFDQFDPEKFVESIDLDFN